MKNHHVLKVKFLGATNTKGSRIRITSERFESSVIIPLKFDEFASFDQAIDYLVSKEFNIIGNAEAADGMYVITDSFHNIK